MLRKSTHGHDDIHIIEQVSRHCKDLGFRLEVRESLVLNIWEEESYPQDQCKNTLKSWLDGHGYRPVIWKKFIEVLEELELLELSDQLRQELSPPSTSQHQSRQPTVQNSKFLNGSTNISNSEQCHELENCSNASMKESKKYRNKNPTGSEPIGTRSFHQIINEVHNMTTIIQEPSTITQRYSHL